MVAPALLLLLLGTLTSPQVQSLTPAGGKRGTEVVVTLSGLRLAEPLGLMLVREGLEVEALEAAKPEACTVKLRIPQECPLGAHPFRLRTRYGLSNLLTFHVGTLDEVAADQKGTKPQPIPLGCTVNGRLGAEDVHRFAVEVQQGARVTVEVQATRLGLGLIDTALAVHGPNGELIARADDTAFGMKDPWLTFVAGAAGTHVLTLSTAYAEASNAGTYRLHVGGFPRPTGALPCGGQPGEELEVELLGTAPGSWVKVKLPDDGSDTCRCFPQDATGTAPTPLLLRVGGPPNQSPVPDAQGKRWIELPGSVHGVVARPDAPVRWSFHGKRGQEIEWRVVARALRSPLDSVLTVRQADGRFVVVSDDGSGLDTVLRFNPPADGEYLIEVRDLLKRGSPEHFFRLEGGARSAAMGMRMVTNQNQREEAVLAVPQGGRAGCVLQVANADYDAGLALLAERLPPGVSASFGPLRRGLNLVPLVLTASADAPLAGAGLRFWASAEKAPASRPAGFVQDVPVVWVRNNQPLVTTPLRELPVAVIEKAPLALELEPPKVPVVRGASLRLKVRIARAPGFTEQVRLRGLWNPPGLGTGQLVLRPDQSEGELTVDANGNATLGTFPFAVVAQVTWRGANLDLCSAFVDLEIDKPWLTAELGKVRCERGADAELVVKLKAQREIAGSCQASLLGLPRGVSADAQEVAPNAELRFALHVAADAQPGRHGGFQLELRVPHAGGTVVHRFGGGEIRIDQPAGSER